MTRFLWLPICLTLLCQFGSAFEVHRKPMKSTLIRTTTTTTTTHRNTRQRMSSATWPLAAEKEEGSSSSSGSGSNVEEYKNAPTKILSNFFTKEDAKTEDPLMDIDFNAPKITKVSNLDTLAQMLDAELYNKEWFVTGNVNPIYFLDDFEFQDPDVKLTGIEDYARGVNKLFNQQTTRAEIISTIASTTVPNTITITWRLSGSVNIGPGLTIKPYICYTDFTIDEESGLIAFQEDRFDIPGWDILLSALFPFVIGKITAPAAPPVPPRPTPPVLPSPKTTSNNNDTSSPLDKFMQLFN